MKVIKEGKIPEKEIPKYGLFYRGHCEKCGCEFEAYGNEFYEDTKDTREISLSLYADTTWKREINLYVNCPTCKEQIKVATKETQWGHQRALEKEISWY